MVIMLIGYAFLCRIEFVINAAGFSDIDMLNKIINKDTQICNKRVRTHTIKHKQNQCVYIITIFVMNRLCRLVYQILACSGEYIIVIVQWIWENHAHTHADTHADTNTLTHPNSFQNKSHHYTGMLILSICFLYSISHDHITFQRIQTRLLTYNHQMYFTPFNIGK